jgi:tripartite-type tricarboxylate transporter receptor subunit TctC
MREAGYPQVECDAWVGVLAPAKTPKEIVTLLHQEMARAVKVPEIENRLVALGFEPSSTNPQELAALINSEMPRWANVIRTANIKPR